MSNQRMVVELSVNDLLKSMEAKLKDAFMTNIVLMVAEHPEILEYNADIIATLCHSIGIDSARIAIEYMADLSMSLPMVDDNSPKN